MSQTVAGYCGNSADGDWDQAEAGGRNQAVGSAPWWEARTRGRFAEGDAARDAGEAAVHLPSGGGLARGRSEMPVSAK